MPLLIPIGRNHDPYHGLSLNIFKRQIDTVRRAVNRDGVSICREKSSTGSLKPIAPFIEDRDNTALRGNVQAFQLGVESKNVRIIADGIDREQLLSLQVEHRHRCVSFTGSKRKTINAVDQKAVSVLASR